MGFMDDKSAAEGLKHLEHIERELEVLKARGGARRTFFLGILQGAGALLGGIIALSLLGWILSLFGVIPGLQTISAYLQEAVSTFNR